jgi:mycobactin polyketide synthetase MbtD
MMPTHRLPDGRVPVLLSAHDPELIRQDASAIADYLARVDDSTDLTGAVASTLLRLRRLRRHRAVVRAADSAELVAGLSAIVRGEEHELVSRSAKTTPPRVAFVFPGQGNQWQAMGADAYRQLPAYREAADRCTQAFASAGFPSPLPYLVSDEERNWSRTEIQAAQFTHAVSLSEAWRACGVLPDVTIGHSLGEVAAAYVAEALSLPDAVALVVARATVVGQLTGRYAMAVLGTGLDIAQSLLAETRGGGRRGAAGPTAWHLQPAVVRRLSRTHQCASTVAAESGRADAEVGVPGRAGEVHRLHAGHRVG